VNDACIVPQKRSCPNVSAVGFGVRFQTAPVGNTFALGFQSQPGVTYQLQQTTNLAPPTVWTPAGSLVGDGAIRTMTDTAATNQMRLYRVWLQQEK